MSGDISRFLDAFPTAPFLHLTAIGDKGVFAGTTVPAGPDLPKTVAQWASSRNKRGNVYFSVNAPGSADPLDKKGDPARKLDKGHIRTLRAVWADLDPIDALEVLPSTDPDNPAMTGRVKEKTRLLGLAEAMRETDFAPSMAIDSGNGVQLIWAFEAPVEATEDNRIAAEEFGKRIEAALGGTENTANVDRVLRLPGTTNMPTAKKRQLGRVECPSRLLYGDGPRYDFDFLDEIAKGTEDEVAPDLVKAGHIILDDPAPLEDEPSGPEIEIDESLPAALLVLLDSDPKLRAAWTRGVKLGKGKDKTGSGLDMTLTLYLCRKLDNHDLELALLGYPFGQLGNGTLKGDAALRRLKQLIEIAEKARVAAKDNTQDGIAEAFAELHEDVVRYCHTANKWYIFDGNTWQQDKTKMAFNWVRQIGRKLDFDGKASTAGGAEKFAQCDERLAVTHETWDPDKFLLGTPGGVVDLRYGTMRAGRPEDYITRSTTVAPKRDPHPIWSKFLDEATKGDKEYQRFLRQVSGYALTGDTREHALFFIYGDGGNGKGVFISVLLGIFGTYAKTSPMETFVASHYDSHPTDLAMLNGARLVTASETEEGRAWAESRVKQLTGADPITARFMRQDFFTFDPEFALLIIGNRKPALKSVDDAIRRRIYMMPFMHKPETKDLLLGQKLVAEYPAILQW